MLRPWCFFLVCLTPLAVVNRGEPGHIAKPLVKNKKINDANFKKLLPGMTSKEVEEILGGPPGVYTPNTTYFLTPSMPSSGYRLKLSVRAMQDLASKFPVKGQKIWYGDEAVITVYFDSELKVLSEKGIFFDQAFVVSE